MISTSQQRQLTATDLISREGLATLKRFIVRLVLQEQEMGQFSSHFTPLRVSTQRMAERYETRHSINVASLIDSETYHELHARLPFLLMEQEAQESRISAQAQALTSLCFSSY